MWLYSEEMPALAQKHCESTSCWRLPRHWAPCTRHRRRRQRTSDAGDSGSKQRTASDERQKTRQPRFAKASRLILARGLQLFVNSSTVLEGAVNASSSTDFARPARCDGRCPWRPWTPQFHVTGERNTARSSNVLMREVTPI